MEITVEIIPMGNINGNWLSYIFDHITIKLTLTIANEFRQIILPKHQQVISTSNNVYRNY